MARAASARAISRRCSRRSSASRPSAEIFNARDLLQAPVRQASSLEHIEHRPWPVPKRPWVMGQTWDDLLFLHYRVPAGQVRPLVPAGLELQEHSGSAWLGVTPFVITGLRARGLLPLPLASSFRELNVRTYVTRGGKPGIWFFSLDASSQLAVGAARRLYAEHEGELYSADIHHRPWPLQPAEARIDLNTMPPLKLDPPEQPLAHYSARQDAVTWPLERA